MRYTHRHKKMAIDGVSQSDINPFEDLEDNTNEAKITDEKAMKKTKATYTKIETAMSSFDDDSKDKKLNADSSQNEANVGSPKKMMGGLYKKLSTHAKKIQRKAT